MTPHRLSYHLEIFVSQIIDVEGLLFINHRDISIEQITAEIAGYESPAVAQQWMNIVLLDDFISEVCGDDWEDSDPGVDQILSVMTQAWTFQIQAKYSNAVFSINKIADSEFGDLGLRLTGSNE